MLPALDTKGTVIELNCCSVACVPFGNVGPTSTVVAIAVAKYDPKTFAPFAWVVAVVLGGVIPLNGEAVPLVNPDKTPVPVLLPVYWIVSFMYCPKAALVASWFTFSITIKPAFGNAAELV